MTQGVGTVQSSSGTGAQGGSAAAGVQQSQGDSSGFLELLSQTSGASGAQPPSASSDKAAKPSTPDATRKPAPAAEATVAESVDPSLRKSLVRQGRRTRTRAGEGSQAQAQALVAMLLKLTPSQVHARLAAMFASGGAGKRLPSGGSALPGATGHGHVSLSALLRQLESQLGQMKGGGSSAGPTGDMRSRKLMQQLLKFARELPQQNTEQARKASAKSQAPLVTASTASAGQPSVPTHPVMHRPPPPAMHGAHVAQDFAQQVQWMTQSGQQFARVAVSPAHLGPVEIHILVEGDRAKVAFGTHHEAAREVLQSALPKLRQVLEAGGLNLVQAEVSGQGAGGQQQQTAGQPFQSAPASLSGTSAGVSAATAPAAQGVVTLTGNGLVDDYA